MSKKKTATKSSSQSSATTPARRVFLGGVDAVTLFELLENHYIDNGEPEGGSAYRRLYKQSLATFLEGDGQETVNFAALLEEVDAMSMVETSMRKAGFVIGFETCRQLLLGELDVAALNGGAE